MGAPGPVDFHASIFPVAAPKPPRSRVRMQTTAYSAFISYSHAADTILAAALQLALHRFAKPWYKLRALHVFRDQSNLAVNPGLWSSITDALDTSSFFVLLA